MPSILDTIKGKARDQLETLDETKLREQLAKGLEKAKEKLPEDPTDPVGMMARQGFSKIEEHEDELGKLGMWGVTAFTAELASGDEHAAQMVYLQTQAGWAELLGAVDAATAADAQAERDRQAAKASALRIIKSIGSAAAKAALPFLLGAVGL